MAFHNVSADDPTILRLAVTLTPMDNTDAICEWFTPGAPDSTYQWRLYPGSQYAADIYKSAWYWTKQQAGMPLEVAIGITAPDFYRGAGKCIIPNAYYLGASATSAKRHWQAQDRGAAERLALEIGDSYLFTTPTAGGFMGEVVTRAGVWARVWAPNMSYTTGDLVSPTVDNGHYYEIGLPNDGQSGPTEPTWPTTPGGSITVDGVTYVEHGVSALFKTYGAISA